MKSWTDTHAHVYLEEFDPDRKDMLARARDQEVNAIYMPNIDYTSIDRMMEAESANPGFCTSMMGLHPCSVKRDFEKELYVVEQWLGKRRFAAIGEMGTDLYWDKTFWEQQKEAFLIQAKWAVREELPLVIHCRESIDPTIELLRSIQGNRLTGVFHCFTGDLIQAKAITDMGFYLGIGGVSTFKNGGLDKVLPEIPRDRIVLETDSPYLAPVPWRGKRNEPSYVSLIAKRVAELMNVDIEELSAATTANANKLFGNNRLPESSMKI